MRLVSIVACISVLSIVVFLYTNNDTDEEVNLQLTSTGTSFDMKTKSGLQLMEGSVVLPPATKYAQVNIMKLTELTEQDYAEKTKHDCTSFIQIGEKKTCLARYSDKEKEINDVASSQYEHIDENGITEILPANIPSRGEIIRSEMEPSEGTQELIEFVQ